MDQVNQIEPKDENEKKLTWQQRLVTDLRDVVVVLVVFLLLFMMAFRIVSVKGPSMYDTLLDGDRLIICQSNAPKSELRKWFPDAEINPLGD